MAGADEICWLPLTELGARTRSRQLSPVEVTEALLGRVDALNGRLNAICTIDPARVRADARRSANLPSRTPLLCARSRGGAEVGARDQRVRMTAATGLPSGGPWWEFCSPPETMTRGSPVTLATSAPPTALAVA